MLDRFGTLFNASKRTNNVKKKAEEEEYKNSLLCCFVLDGLGRKIGESVAIDKDIMIIKSRAKYLGVPLKHVEFDGKKILVKGLVDQNKAEELGEKWLNTSFKNRSKS